MRDKTLAPHPKTNSKFILVQYDKNLLQSNGHSRNLGIPIDGYFGRSLSSYMGIIVVSPGK